MAITKRAVKLSLMIVLVCLVSFPARGGEMITSEMITLRDCIEAALVRSNDLLISKIDLDRARLNVELQEAGNDWQASATSSFTKGLANSFSYSKYYLATGESDKAYDSESHSKEVSGGLSFSRKLKDLITIKLYSQNTLTEGTGRSVKGGTMQESILDQYAETVYETKKNFLEHGVEVTIPLYGYERDERVFNNEQNYYDIATQETLYESNRQGVIDEVTDLYANMVKDRLSARAYREEIGSFEEIIDLMNMQLKRGMISVLDLQEQEIELQNKILSKEKVESDIRLGCLKLSAKTGLDIQPGSAMEEYLELTPFDLDPQEVASYSFEHYKDLKTLYLERDKVKSELGEIDATYKPSVSLTVGYKLDGQNSTFDQAQDEYDGGYSAAVSMEYPFWNEGQIAIERRLKQKELERVEREIEKTRNTVTLTVLESMFTLEKLEKEYENILKKIDLTKNNLKISEIRFEQGKMKKIDLLKMQFKLSTQKTQKLNTICSYNSEVMKLKRYLENPGAGGGGDLGTGE